MIYKVSLSASMMGMTITHNFESVVDSEEEAEKFGEDAWNLYNSWSEGYGKAADEHGG